MVINFGQYNIPYFQSIKYKYLNNLIFLFSVIFYLIYYLFNMNIVRKIEFYA